MSIILVETIYRGDVIGEELITEHGDLTQLPVISPDMEFIRREHKSFVLTDEGIIAVRKTRSRPTFYKTISKPEKSICISNPQILGRKYHLDSAADTIWIDHQVAGLQCFTRITCLPAIREPRHFNV